MICRKLLLAGMVLCLGAVAAPAWAHGDIQATDPEPQTTVRRAPRSVAVTFTEAPTAQAVMKVTDGCNRDVAQGIDVADATATVRVATGQPGKWRVSYRVISSVDGHLTRGGYAFTVAGKKDCTPDEEPSDDPGDGPAQGAPDDDEEPESSGAPIVPIALGAAALIGVALLVRRSGSG